MGLLPSSSSLGAWRSWLSLAAGFDEADFEGMGGMPGRRRGPVDTSQLYNTLGVEKVPLVSVTLSPSLSPSLSLILPPCHTGP